MVIRVYLSRTSGNIEIKKHQEQIIQILQGWKIDFEEIDISDPHCKDERDYMRKCGKVLPGNKYPLPPQIFTDDKYLGGYDELYNSNEDDNLFEFLGLPRPQIETSQNGYSHETPLEHQAASVTKIECDGNQEQPADEQMESEEEINNAKEIRSSDESDRDEEEDKD